MTESLETAVQRAAINIRLRGVWRACLSCEYSLLCVSPGPADFFLTWHRCTRCGVVYALTGGFEDMASSGLSRYSRARQIRLTAALPDACPLEVFQVPKTENGCTAMCNRCLDKQMLQARERRRKKRGQ